jgi:hypothetical protein
MGCVCSSAGMEASFVGMGTSFMGVVASWIDEFVSFAGMASFVE